MNHGAPQILDMRTDQQKANDLKDAIAFFSERLEKCKDLLYQVEGGMRARKIDATQRDIVFALRAKGCRVLHLHTVGQGCPDLLVATPEGRTFLLECKSPGGTLTKDQETWFADWPGQIVIATSAEQALQAIGRRDAE